MAKKTSAVWVTTTDNGPLMGRVVTTHALKERAEAAARALESRTGRKHHVEPAQIAELVQHGVSYTTACQVVAGKAIAAARVEIGR